MSDAVLNLDEMLADFDEMNQDLLRSRRFLKKLHKRKQRSWERLGREAEKRAWGQSKRGALTKAGTEFLKTKRLLESRKNIKALRGKRLTTLSAKRKARRLIKRGGLQFEF